MGMRSLIEYEIAHVYGRLACTITSPWAQGGTKKTPKQISENVAAEAQHNNKNVIKIRSKWTNTPPTK